MSIFPRIRDPRDVPAALPAGTFANFRTTRAGKTAPICQGCCRTGRATTPTDRGEPDAWALARGWSAAPFYADSLHSDGSRGTTFLCAHCNKVLDAGLDLVLRDGTRTRLIR